MRKVRSSSTCSRGSPPKTSTRRRAAPAENSSVSCSLAFMRVLSLVLPAGRHGADRAARARAAGWAAARPSGAGAGSAQSSASIAGRLAKWWSDGGPTAVRVARCAGRRARGRGGRRSGARSAPGDGDGDVRARVTARACRQTRSRVRVAGELARGSRGTPRRRSPRRTVSPASAAASHLRRGSRRAASRSSSVRRGSARRTPRASSSARTTKASSSSSHDGRRTRAPRKAVISTTPSASRSRSASRTGAWLVPNSRATRVSTIRAPGRVAAVEDRLEEAILDLVAEDAAGDRGVGRHRRGRPVACADRDGAATLTRISTTPVLPSTRIRSPVLMRVRADRGADDRRDAVLAGEDGRVRHGPAGVGHDRDDLAVQDLPGRVGHLADEDLARPEAVELGLGHDDARHALDDARRAGDAADLRRSTSPRAVELVREAPQVEVREGELRRRDRADPVLGLDLLGRGALGPRGRDDGPPVDAGRVADERPQLVVAEQDRRRRGRRARPSRPASRRGRRARGGRGRWRPGRCRSGGPG